MILLDTQTLVWMMEGSNKLGAHAIRHEEESDKVAISVMTAWELGLLVSRGRIKLRLSLEAWLQVVADRGAIMIPVTKNIALDAGSLPGDIHGDPADRMIIATARSMGCPLITADGKILAYAKAGHVQAIDARH